MGASIPHSAEYRPEVDGLRAVAVASVVAYHIDKAWLPGGYVGVDIFFVISGFLITSIIWRELQGGTFSLANFYLRRIRRIIPVMLVVVAATVLAGALLLLPDALARLSLSAIFSVASAANIYFWRYLDDDYFAEASDQEPLLHLWSLGVEEQFYLVWPLLLLAIASVRKNRAALAIVVAAGIAIASFAMAEATNESNPKLSYFMLPTRAGELMIGALLALGLNRVRGQRWLDAPPASEAVAVAGLGAIGYALFFLDDLSPFPGVNALYPCVGAALVILAGARSRILQWLLASKPMVWIGLLSYSLYLWHWPILAFIRYFYGTVGPAHAAIAVAAMLALSVLSYRFVERPSRRVRWPGAMQVAVLLLLPAALVVAPAAYIERADGLKARIESSAGYRKALKVLEEETAAAFSFEYNCQVSRHVPGILSESRCLIGSQHPKAGGPRVLLWGDSHAAHHVGVLDEIARHAGIRIRNATHTSCPPVFDGEYSYGKYKAGCSAFRPYIRERIRSGEFDTVILGGKWVAYDRQPGFRSDLLRTIEEIRLGDTRVVLLGQVPTLKTYNRECDMRWLRLGGSNCSELRTSNKGHAFNEFLASRATTDGAVSYLDVGREICDATSCPAYLEGKPIYFDTSHLSMRGSKRVGRRLIQSGFGDAWVMAITGQAPNSGKPTPVSRDHRALPRGDTSGTNASSTFHNLPAELEFGAPYTVISDTTIDDGEIGTRKVILRLEETNVRSIEADATKHMITAGYRLTGASIARGGQRSNFRGRRGERISILVLPRSSGSSSGEPPPETIEIVHSWPRDTIRRMQ